MDAGLTTVVNCRRSPREVEVYVGRGTMRDEIVRLGIDIERVRVGRDLGMLGNPVPIDKRCTCGETHGRDDIGSALRCYARYLLARCLRDRPYAHAVEVCEGRVLGCWCDGSCHGRVIAEVVDRGLIHDAQERAAIIEYDGGIHRVDAEAAAVESTLRRLHLPLHQPRLL